MNIDFSRLDEMVNDIYFPAFKFRGRFLVLFGGSGSGKSWAIAQKIIYRMVTEDDHNILCVRATGNTLHRSSFALLKATILDWKLGDLFQINEADGKEKIIFLPNGNQIIFSGLDDVEKLKSIFNITSVWVEEASETQETDFRELNRRLRGYQGRNKNGVPKYMQIMITFNPISQLHWLKKRFYDDPDKVLIWDSEDARTIGKVNISKTMVIHSTYKDNKWIDRAYHEEMEQLKEYDEFEYNIYALGLWGITGKVYFNGEKLDHRILQVQKDKPIKRGCFEYQTYFNQYENEVMIDNSTIKWIDDDKGDMLIYEDVQRGHPYCIGGDTAGEGSDANISQVIDNHTGKQVAKFKLTYDEDLYARQTYCLGVYYNMALIGVETNFSTHPMKILTQLQYPNQYIREERPDSHTGKLAKIYGFFTNKATRPDMLGILRTIVREHTDYICDLETLNEMTTFIINEKGRPEAAAGEHDDHIMALSIAYRIRHQMRTFIVMDERELTPVEKDKERLAKQFGKKNRKLRKALS